jgi:hypothetical protein
MSTVRELSIEELKALIEEVVEEKLREMLGDPDEGLALRPDIQERLHLRANPTAAGVPAFGDFPQQAITGFCPLCDKPFQRADLIHRRICQYSSIPRT